MWYSKFTEGSAVVHTLTHSLGLFFYAAAAIAYDRVGFDATRKCMPRFWFKNTCSFFKRDGVVQKINPIKQSSLAKELGISIMGDKKLF